VPINTKTIGKLDLDKFVEAVSGIYIKKDEERSIWDVWLHATHHASAIGEEVRKSVPGEKLLIEIADFAMWLFTFVGKIKGNFSTFDSNCKSEGEIEELTIRAQYGFSDIIWLKYPGICPVCFWHRIEKKIDPTSAGFNHSCDCLLYEVEKRDQSKKREHVARLRQYAREHMANKPKDVDNWQCMFQQIYEANLRHINLVDIAFHLLEEVGEVSDSMVRMYTFTTGENGNFKQDEPKWRQIWLEEEISDVASWLFTLINHLKFIPEIAKAFEKYLYQGAEPFNFNENYKLSRIIWNRYGNEGLGKFICPSCKKEICECELLFVKDNALYQKLLQFAGN
jgi:NTP pyrophosphatase (non-canonical NTP hydrolase)